MYFLELCIFGVIYSSSFQSPLVQYNIACMSTYVHDDPSVIVAQLHICPIPSIETQHIIDVIYERLIAQVHFVGYDCRRGGSWERVFFFRSERGRISGHVLIVFSQIVQTKAVNRLSVHHSFDEGNGLWSSKNFRGQPLA